MPKNKSFIFILSSFFIFLAYQNASADIATIGSAFDNNHPNESILYSFIVLFVLVAFVIAFSLIILGKIRRNKKSKNNPFLKK